MPDQRERSYMDAAARSQFVGNYTKLLTHAWSDEGFAGRLRSDPKQVLDEVGLTVPASATVEILDTQGEGSLDEQVALWEQGIASGDIKLYVPKVPQVETAELSESELEGVAGGDTYCCCCSPCCTCT
jgi:hypothetical protein